MPVPTIDTPTVQAEGTPAPVTPVAPIGAFSGAPLGAGLEEMGKHLFEFGWAGYHEAAKTHAEAAETEFQKQALQIRDKYKNLSYLQALDKHAEVTAELEQARAKIGQGLNSKYGLSLYNNNSLRNSRFVQESIDSHFETQNKAYQKIVYLDGVKTSLTSVTRFAQDKNWGGVDNTIQSIYQKGLDRALAEGYPAEEAEKHAALEAQKGTDALFKMLLHKGSEVDPSVTKDLLTKYTEKGWVSPGKLTDSQNQLNASEASKWATHAHFNFPRIDHLGNADKEGFIPYASYAKAVKSLDLDDPKYEQKFDRLTHLYNAENEAFRRAGSQLAGDIRTRKEIGDEESELWQKLGRLHPEIRDSMIEHEQRNMRADVRARRATVAWYRSNVRWTEHQQQGASKDVTGNMRMYLSSLSKSQLAEIDEATVKESIMRNYAAKGATGEPDGAATARTVDYLKRLKENKLSPLEKKIDSIAAKGLSQGYDGDRAKISSNMGRAHEMLAEYLEEHPKDANPTDMLKLVTDNFTKGGWFSGPRPGESYERKIKPKPVAPAAPQRPPGLPASGVYSPKLKIWVVPSADGTGYEPFKGGK